MSVEHITGDLTLFPNGINVIAQSCNAQGAMNSGLAKAIRDKWPEVFNDYKTTYDHEGLAMGSLVVTTLPDGKKIVSAITQRFYRKDPADKTRFMDYEALYVALETLRDALEHGMREGRGPYVLGLPYLLSADRAGGAWQIIEPMIQFIFAASSVQTYIVHLP